VRRVSGDKSRKREKQREKNNPRATVVERVDTTEPQSKRRTKKIWWFEWKQNTDVDLFLCRGLVVAVVVVAVVVVAVRYGPP